MTAKCAFDCRPIIVFNKLSQGDSFFPDAEEVSLRNAGHLLSVQFLCGVVVRCGLVSMPLPLSIVVVQPPPAVALKETVSFSAVAFFRPSGDVFVRIHVSSFT